MGKETVLSLGANLGDRLKTMEDAIASLSRLPGTRVISVSSYYETKPFGVENQPDYLNCCARILTDLSPNALLGACLGIEAAAGRERVEVWGARVLDIDVLLYEGVTVSTPELTLPHPRMLERAFVLVPLAEIYPDRRVLGLSFADELAQLDCSGVLLYRNL